MPDESARMSRSLMALVGVLLPVIGAAAGWGAAEMRNQQVAQGLLKLEARHEDDLRQVREELREVQRELADERVWRAAHEKESTERWKQVEPRRR